MPDRGLLRYEARLALGPSALPVLALPAYAGFRKLLAATGALEMSAGALSAFVFVLPVSAALAAAHLGMIESEAGFAELRSSFPEPAWRLPLMRTLEALLLIALSALLGWASFTLVLGRPVLLDWILPGLPPALFLTAVALLVGDLTQNYWATGGLVLAWFLVDFVTTGAVSGPFFLFLPAYPMPRYSPELNRALLLGTAVILLAANAWLASHARERLVRMNALDL